MIITQEDLDIIADIHGRFEEALKETSKKYPAIQPAHIMVANFHLLEEIHEVVGRA